MLKEIFENHRKLIINTDIDGIFCGLILQHSFSCEIVGFCNSDDKIWIEKSSVDSIKDCVFIDIFVENKDIFCIDQHIVSYNMLHHDELSKNSKKINPNLLNPRFFLPSDSYYVKYPFGTVHFLISDLEKDGLEFNFNLYKKIGNLTAADYILRADDALHTSLSAYINNAQNWWKWLYEYSGKGKTTLNLINYIYRNSLKTQKIKSEISKIVKSKPYFCDKGDGCFMDILDSKGNLKSGFKNFIDFCAEILDLKTIKIPEKLETIIGVPKKITFNDSHYEELAQFSTINHETVFSYAFIWSEAKANHFSYTILRL